MRDLCATSIRRCLSDVSRILLLIQYEINIDRGGGLVGSEGVKGGTVIVRCNERVAVFFVVRSDVLPLFHFPLWVH